MSRSLEKFCGQCHHFHPISDESSLAIARTHAQALIETGQRSPEALPIAQDLKEGIRQLGQPQLGFCTAFGFREVSLNIKRCQHVLTP